MSMGLDMFLYDKREYDDHLKKGADYVSGKSNEEYDDSYPIELAYWRKANAIHNYFCSVGRPIKEEFRYEVSREQLIDLLAYIKLILNKEEPDRTTLAKLVLPTTSGFFFGSIEYDKYYFDELESTKEKIEQVLDLNNTDSFIYSAYW